MAGLRVGIDNYGLQPLGLSPLDLLRWALDNGAAGVQFSGLSPEENRYTDGSYLKDITQYAASHDLYLEWGGGQHIPLDMESWKPKDVVSANRKAVEEAFTLGARIVRSCSGGLMRWNAENPGTETLLQLTAESLRSQAQMFRDHGVVLAIETHFEFTTHELLRLFRMCDTGPGDYLGICLDTMNLLTMLEDPVRAAERILPWVVSTHIKDGALILTDLGLRAFPVPVGSGIVDFRQILERIESLPFPVNLSVEDHGGSFDLPVFDSRFLSEFPDLSLGEFVDLVRLSRVSEKAYRKADIQIIDRNGWPSVCEERIKHDIESLKAIAGCLFAE